MKTESEIREEIRKYRAWADENNALGHYELAAHCSRAADILKWVLEK